MLGLSVVVLEDLADADADFGSVDFMAAGGEAGLAGARGTASRTVNFVAVMELPIVVTEIDCPAVKADKSPFFPSICILAAGDNLNDINLSRLTMRIVMTRDGTDTDSKMPE